MLTRIRQVPQLNNIAIRLHKRFQGLSIHVMKSLKAVNIADIKLVIRSTLLDCSCDISTEVRTCLDRLREIEDVEEIVSFLMENRLIGFLNYGLFKNISDLLINDQTINTYFESYEAEYCQLLEASNFDLHVSIFCEYPDLSPTTAIGLPDILFQSKYSSRNLSSLHYELEEKEKVIENMTQELQFAQSELQQKNEQLTTLHGEFQTLQTQYQQTERQLQQDLQQSQQDRETVMQEYEERERQLNQQLQQAHSALDQSQQERRDLEEGFVEKIQTFETLHEELESHEAKIIEFDDTEDNLYQLVQESTIALQEAQEANTLLRQQVQRYEEQQSWVVGAEEIETTDDIIGRGGWGVVKVAKFRGISVAAKCLHEIILSPYNMSIFSREMEIAAQVRHPNLLQFIGATRAGTPIILSELMASNLRKELEKHSMDCPQIIRICIDTSAALNYLHLWRPNPILHRDVSSPNVLLERSDREMWKAKLADFGSANLSFSISAHSVAPGNPVYSAPEACSPEMHSPAMDVYSFGVLMIEMILREPPALTAIQRKARAETVQWPVMKSIILNCIAYASQNRPPIAEVLQMLNDLKL